MLKNGIEIKPYVRNKKGLYYVVLVYNNAAGKRRDKSFPTKLPVKGNKKKAEAMAQEILNNFEVPLEDLYIQNTDNGKRDTNDDVVIVPISSLPLSKIGKSMYHICCLRIIWKSTCQ